jgi:hypothetical protein
VVAFAPRQFLYLLIGELGRVGDLVDGHLEGFVRLVGFEFARWVLAFVMAAAPGKTDHSFLADR